MTSISAQILSEVDASRKVFYDPAGEAYYRGGPGKPSDADFVATRGLTSVEGKYLAAAEQVRRGAIFDTSHSSTIKAVIVLDRVLGVGFREYRLRELFNIVRTPELVLSGDVGTVFSATGRVLPLQEAPVLNETYARTTWDLAATGEPIAEPVVGAGRQQQAAETVALALALLGLGGAGEIRGMVARAYAPSWRAA